MLQKASNVQKGSELVLCANPKDRWKVLKPLLLILFIAMLIGCEGNTRQNGVAAYPDFCLEDSSTRQRFYLNQHKGRIVLLVFVSTGCAYCKLELNALGIYKDRMDQLGVVAVSILMDPENRSSSEYGLAASKNIYPVLLDWKKKVSRQFNIYAVPTAVVIDQEGAETFRRSGYSSAIMEEIQRHLAVLAEKKQ